MGLLASSRAESDKESPLSLRTRYELSRALREIDTRSTGIDDFFPRLLDLFLEQLPAQLCRILVVDPALKIDHGWQQAAFEPALRLSGVIGQKIYAGIEHYAITQRSAVRVDDMRRDERIVPTGRTQGLKAKSALCAPLLIGTRVVGVVTLTTPGIAQYGDHELALVELLSAEAALAVNHACRYDAARRQLQVLELLNEASQAINLSLDLQQIMQSLLSKMNELLHAEACSIALVDTQTGELVYEVAEGAGSSAIVGMRLPLDKGIAGWVQRNATPALVPDANRDERFAMEGDIRTGYPTQSIICAPLKTKEQVLGTIQAINRIEGMFSSEDLSLLVSLANLAASAVANARLLAASQAAEARYLGLFEDNVDPILLTTMSGEIIEVNQKTVEFLGYSRQALIGKSILDLHTSDSASALSTRSSGVLIFTSQVVTHEQHHIPVEVHAKVIDSGNGELLQWIERDISEQVELEEMRSDMTAMLFHDLQSPLGNVLSSLELVEMDLPADTDPTIRYMLDVASISGRRLQALISSLLDINRLEAGLPLTEREMIHVRNLFTEAQQLVAAGLERRGVQLELALPSALPPVFVDADMIRRVVINLLDNALKYTPMHSVVAATATAPDEHGFVTISICDQGQGIPDAYRAVIFDKFRRLKGKDAPRGLGLGLAFCRLAVEAHGGRIWVDDNPAGGARFNFALPSQRTMD